MATFHLEAENGKEISMAPIADTEQKEIEQVALVIPGSVFSPMNSTVVWRVVWKLMC